MTTARLEARSPSAVSARELVEWLGDPHEPLRTLARKRLRERRDPDALLLAMRWLDEPRVPHAAEEAHSLLERLTVDDVALATKVLDGEPHPGAIRWAAQVAARRDVPDLIERIRALARHSDAAVRRAALSGLVADPDSRTHVIAAFEDPEVSVREVALTAWEQRPPARTAMEALARALLAFAPRASTPRERRAVASAAAYLEDAEVLATLSNDADVTVRALALGARSALDLLSPEERAQASTHDDPWIRAAVLDEDTAGRASLHDADPTVRRTALEWLLRDQRALFARADALESDLPLPVGEGSLLTVALACVRAPDAWMRARAAEILIPERDREELRALLKLSRDPSPMVRAAAATPLESCEALGVLLDDLLHGPQPETDPDVRASAWTWRLRDADDAAFERLRAALQSSNEPARVASHLEALTLTFPDALLVSAPDVANHVPSRPPRTPRPAARVPEAPPRLASRPLGNTGLRVSPLVLSGVHLTSPEPFAEAHAAGVDTFFWEPRYAALTRFLHDARRQRDGLVLVAGTYHAGPRALRRDVESALRRLRTSWLDVFLLFWVRAPERLSDEDFTALEQLRAEGKVRAFGFSTHLRDLAREALVKHPWPVVMTRHSAAHPGAESAFLPEALARGTGVLAFTSTCYGRLLRPTRDTPAGTALPSAVDCYRYSLSQPGISACLTAPRSRRELLRNLDVLSKPTLGPEHLAPLREHGARVRAWGRQLDALVRRAPGGPRDALLALLADDDLPSKGRM